MRTHGDVSMKVNNEHSNPSGFWLVSLAALLIFVAVALVVVQPFYAANGEAAAATYSHGDLYVTIPYRAAHAGTGQLIMETVDPTPMVPGRAERQTEIVAGKGR